MKSKKRLESILEKIEDIDYFVSQCDGKISRALSHRVYRPAIRMQLVAMAEQFQKLKDDNAFEILSHFDPEELRGMSVVRNYIAHDYERVDDAILELIIRKHLPVMRQKIEDLLANL